jgi:hypothetical protein
MQDFSYYSVWSEGDILATGHKEGFCLVDSICNEGVEPSTGNTECSSLTAGCADSYPSGLGCQYVDVTDLAPGQYTLRVELNPLRVIEEESYENNVVEETFELCKPQYNVKLRIDDAQPPYTKRRFRLSAKLKQAENPSFRPHRQGLEVSVRLDERELFGGWYPAQLYPGKLGEGCIPQDGWVKLAKNRWKYTNLSGYDTECFSQSSGGIRSAYLVQTARHLKIYLKGELDITNVPPRPNAGTFNLSTLYNLGQGSCTHSIIRHCSRTGPEGNQYVMCH